MPDRALIWRMSFGVASGAHRLASRAQMQRRGTEVEEDRVNPLEGARPSLADARLEVLHGADLRRPHAPGIERLRSSHAALERRRCRRSHAVLTTGELCLEPLAQGLGTMNGEGPPGAWLRIEAVGEPRLLPRALVKER